MSPIALHRRYSPGFNRRSFIIKSFFDNDSEKAGTDVAAQKVAGSLTKEGIKAILNFAPVAINVDEDVWCLSVDLTTKLEALAYYMSFTKDKLWKIIN